MKVAIIIPSFNQGPFLEETLESIYAQENVDCEILVFDGGSTDQTVELLRRHDARLAYWESTPDRGQTHAINKGLARMSADVWMYLNSDDLLAPGALSTVKRIFADPSVMWVAGSCENFDSTGAIGGIQVEPAVRMKDYVAPWNRPTSYVFPFSGSCYMRREVFEKIGYFEETYSYSMDMEYYSRAVFEGHFRPMITNEVLAKWRWHPESKTMSRGIAYAFRSDEVRIAQRYAHYLSAAEQDELNSEVGLQLKWLPVRESMWLLGQKRRKEALSVIIGAARKAPELLVFRPWLGALRRICAS